MKWVKLKKYLEESGDTPDAIQKKIARGLWIEGVQFKEGADGVRYYNLEAIDRWIETGAAGAPSPANESKGSPSVSSGQGRGSSSTSGSKASAVANA